MNTDAPAAAPAPATPQQNNPAPAVPPVKATNASGDVSNPFVVSINGLISILKVNPVSSILAPFLIQLIFIAIILLSFLASGLGSSSGLMFVGVFIAYIAIVPSVVSAPIIVAAASTRGETIASKAVISKALSKTLPVLGLILLSYVLTVIGFLLLVIPGLIMLARLSLAPIVMFEENLGVIASLKRSAALTKGHVFEIYGAIMAGAFLSGGGLLSSVVGIAPLIGRYHQYRQASQTKTHWLNYLLTFAPLILVASFVALFITLAKGAENKVNDLYNTNGNIRNTIQPSTNDFDSGSGSFYDSSNYRYDSSNSN